MTASERGTCHIINSSRRIRYDAWMQAMIIIIAQRSAARAASTQHIINQFGNDMLGEAMASIYDEAIY